MTWLEILRIISMVMSSVALGFGLVSFRLSLRNNRRLMEENHRLIMRNLALAEENRQLRQAFETMS